MTANDHRPPPQLATDTLRRALAPVPSAFELSLVVPAFNEEARLPAMLEQLATALPHDRTELIVVDDGSSDETAAVAERALAEFPYGTVHRLPENHGKGRALREGISVARGTKIVFLDADSATDPRCLVELLGALDRADVAVGSRSHADSVVQSARLHRKVLGVAFNGLVRALTGLRLRDTQCGFKGFRAPAASLLFGLAEVDGFAIDVEILANADRLGMRIEEVPVRWRHVPGSKVDAVADSVRMTVAATKAARFANHRPVRALRVDGTVLDEVAHQLSNLGIQAVLTEGSGCVDVLAVHPGCLDVAALALTEAGWEPRPVVLDSASLLRSRRRGRTAGLCTRVVVTP
jgi:dolichyl-phosphate beta-glucosyltransferase